MRDPRDIRALAEDALAAQFDLYAAIEVYLTHRRRRDASVSSLTAALGAYLGRPYLSDNILGDAFEILDPLQEQGAGE